MLTKFRKPPELLSFSIILLKIILFCKEKKKNEENENNLYFQIVDERDESIRWFDIKRFKM